MWCRVALALVLVPCAAGCGHDEPRIPPTCLDTDRAGYERALRAAPGPVRLPGGTAISECLRRVRTDAELQTLGTTLHGVAEDLALRARERDDVDAAARLGYLSGAVSAGAARSAGISAELARRVQVAGSGLADVSPELARALRDGQDAGRARG